MAQRYRRRSFSALPSPSVSRKTVTIGTHLCPLAAIPRPLRSARIVNSSAPPSTGTLSRRKVLRGFSDSDSSDWAVELCAQQINWEACESSKTRERTKWIWEGWRLVGSTVFSSLPREVLVLILSYFLENRCSSFLHHTQKYVD